MTKIDTRNIVGLKEIFLFCAFSSCLTLAACSSHNPPEWSQEAKRFSTNSCPLKISTVGETFKTAGQVKYRMTPEVLEEIYVLRELEKSFEVSHKSGGQMAFNSENEGRVNFESKERKLRLYQLFWGVPNSAWHSVREEIEEGVFRTRPGTYRLRILYSLDARAVHGNICFAQTNYFVVEEESVWISTNP